MSPFYFFLKEKMAKNCEILKSKKEPSSEINMIIQKRKFDRFDFGIWLISHFHLENVSCSCHFIYPISMYLINN